MIPARLLVRLWFAALAAGAALAAPQHPDQPPAAQSDGSSAKAAPDAPALFKSLCAACHGENGDGNGTTKLDRPARSFKDGGFSYGNTPEAIAKTLAYGIPGSVMPSFGKTLDDAQRKLLAKYVIELGPNDQPTESPDRVMVVKDRALVARGKLPPIVEGGEEIPRGLLVGTPDGFTFAYRTDDLRLIAVYQGEFAERTDWMGRGGTQLKPLGKLVASYDEGSPFKAWAESGAARVELSGSRLVHTYVDRGRAVLQYELTSEAGSPSVRVSECPVVDASRFGTGWSRELHIKNLRDYALTLGLLSGHGLKGDALREIDMPGMHVRVLADGSAVIDAMNPIRAEDQLLVRTHGSSYRIRIDIGEARRINLTTWFVPKWDAATEQQWRAEVQK